MTLINKDNFDILIVLKKTISYISTNIFILFIYFIFLLTIYSLLYILTYKYLFIHFPVLGPISLQIFLFLFFYVCSSGISYHVVNNISEIYFDIKEFYLFFLRRFSILFFHFISLLMFYILYSIVFCIFMVFICFFAQPVNIIYLGIFSFLYIYFFTYIFIYQSLALPVYINDYFLYSESIKESLSLTRPKKVKVKIFFILFILFCFSFIISFFSTISITLSHFINCNVNSLHQIFTITHSIFPNKGDILKFFKNFFYISSLLSLPLSLLINIMTSIIYVELRAD